jgi:hypothetical protein
MTGTRERGENGDKVITSEPLRPLRGSTTTQCPASLLRGVRQGVNCKHRNNVLQRIRRQINIPTLFPLPVTILRLHNRTKHFTFLYFEKLHFDHENSLMVSELHSEYPC